VIHYVCWRSTVVVLLVIDDCSCRFPTIVVRDIEFVLVFILILFSLMPASWFTHYITLHHYRCCSYSALDTTWIYFWNSELLRCVCCFPSFYRFITLISLSFVVLRTLLLFITPFVHVPFTCCLTGKLIRYHSSIPLFSWWYGGWFGSCYSLLIALPGCCSWLLFLTLHTLRWLPLPIASIADYRLPSGYDSAMAWWFWYYLFWVFWWTTVI